MLERQLVKVFLKWFTIGIIVGILLPGCSAQWHLRKAIKKDPQLFSDTLTVKNDTFYIDVPPVSFDSPFVRDSLIILTDTKTETKVKYRYSTVTDSIFVEAECPPTEVIEKERVVTEVLEPRRIDKLKWALFGGIPLAILLTLLALIKRRK